MDLHTLRKAPANSQLDILADWVHELQERVVQLEEKVTAPETQKAPVAPSILSKGKLK